MLERKERKKLKERLIFTLLIDLLELKLGE